MIGDGPLAFQTFDNTQPSLTKAVFSTLECPYDDVKCIIRSALSISGTIHFYLSIYLAADVCLYSEQSACSPIYEEFQLCTTPLHIDMLRGLKALKTISIIPKCMCVVHHRSHR